MQFFYVKVLEFVHIMFKFYVCALFTRLIKKSRTVVKPPHLALLIKKHRSKNIPEFVSIDEFSWNYILVQTLKGMAVSIWNFV